MKIIRADAFKGNRRFLNSSPSKIRTRKTEVFSVVVHNIYIDVYRRGKKKIGLLTILLLSNVCVCVCQNIYHESLSFG